jgi:hypothetical protein
LCRVGAARIVLTRDVRAAGRVAGELPASETARLWADVLGKVPLFAGVPARHVRRIASLGTLARFEAKEPIVNAGDPGDAFYVILSGPRQGPASKRTCRGGTRSRCLLW